MQSINDFIHPQPTTKPVVTFQGNDPTSSTTTQTLSNSAFNQSEDIPKDDMMTLASSRLHIPSMVPHRAGTQRPLKQYIDHIWHGLPRAAKATVILSFISTVLLIAYGITAVSFRSYDEEAHIATVIIVRITCNFD